MRARAVLAVSTLVLVSASLSLADESNRKIQFTFIEPVAIPAVHEHSRAVLPPGSYVFKIFDSTTNRHIVQICNQGETEIYATIVAVPETRLKATDYDDVVLTFRETPAGTPQELRTMFYPGREWGEEFVYPKLDAAEIAKAANVTVFGKLIKVEAVPEAPTIAEPSAQERVR